MNSIDQMVQIALGEDYQLLKEIGYIQPCQTAQNQTKIENCPTNSFDWMVSILDKQYENCTS